MDKINYENTPARRRRTCVTLTRKEFKKLKKESATTGKSIQTLLKEEFFRHPPIKPLMDDQASASLIRELQGIVGESGQLAEDLKNGRWDGHSQKLVRVADRIRTVRKFVEGFLPNQS